MKPLTRLQVDSLQRALAVLERASPDGKPSDEGDGPINSSFAVGYAKGAIRHALGLPDGTIAKTEHRS